LYVLFLIYHFLFLFNGKILKLLFIPCSVCQFTESSVGDMS